MRGKDDRFILCKGFVDDFVENFAVEGSVTIKENEKEKLESEFVESVCMNEKKCTNFEIQSKSIGFDDAK